ncbi:NADH dehydrogenase 1 alpha subcomplex subunit 2-like protein [Ramicandelaber brevisporus]|nr:NADH dehydrogenase 1 alpha subcomplex subunit 2-like protein [Ramicandelaber brevisporus]
MAAAWRTVPAALKELRIHLCQVSPSSNNLRQFVLNHYNPIKKANPALPVLIREAVGVEPRVFARYSYGVEKNVNVEGKSVEEVEKLVRGLVDSIPQEAERVTAAGSKAKIASA